MGHAWAIEMLEQSAAGKRRMAEWEAKEAAVLLEKAQGYLTRAETDLAEADRLDAAVSALRQS